MIQALRPAKSPCVAHSTKSACRAGLSGFPIWASEIPIRALAQICVYAICVCAVFFATVPPLGAQAVAVAQVEGQVMDSTGSAIPNAKVTITQTETGLSRTATTNSTGYYSLPELAVGPYKLQVTAQGFRDYVQTGIELHVGTNVQQNVTMQVGQVNSTVEVHASAGMVETKDNAISQVIDQRNMVDLPLNGRQATQLILLSGAAVTAPGASSLVGTKSFYSSTTISVAGGTDNGTNYLLDGGYNTDTFSNVNMPFPFPDALQEFNVQTSALPAQYGEHPGGVVNVVTKAGSNQFHGDLFDFLRNGDLNARGFFATSRDSLKRNQFGGTVGGPIRRDKLFFFAGYQGTPVRSNPPSTISYVPTSPVAQGDFSAIEAATCVSTGAKTLKDPVTAQPFPGNQIPVSRFDPSAVKLLQYLPASASPCGTVTYGIPANTSDNQIIGRADWAISAKHNFFGRYFVDGYNLPASFSSSNALVTTASGNYERAQTITLGETYTINPTTLNSVHATFLRRRDNRGPTAQGISPKDIGSNLFDPDPNFLNLTVSGYFSTYCGTCAAAYFNSNTWSYTDDLSLIRGRHQLMFGVDMIRTQLNADNAYNRDGQFSFNGQFTTSAVADYMLGLQNSFDQSKAQLTANRETEPGLYAQDTFRLNQHLTINAGVRWEPMLFPQDVYGRGSSFNLADFTNNVHSSVYPSGAAGMLYYGDKGISKSFTSDSWRDISPRLGLVIAPGKSGRDTVRIGAAILYDSPMLFFNERVQSNPPFVNEIITTSPGPLSNPWLGYPGGNPFPGSAAFFPTSAQYVVVPSTLRPTYITNWNVSYQHQFGGSWLATASFLGNKATHLWVTQQANPSVYIPGTCGTSACSTTSNTQSRRVLTLLNPSQGQYIGNLYIADDGSNSDYDALLASVQHRLSKGYTLLANYTLSHCISDLDFNGEISASIFENPNTLRQDRGPCIFDVRQMFNASFVATSPKIGTRWISAIVGNWQLAPIISARTGLPMNVTTGTDNSLTGVGQDRPNLISPTPYNSEWGPKLQFLTAAAFQANALGTFGSLGRDALFSPGLFQLDAALSRLFSITERCRLEARFEAFNAINHTNFAAPTTALNSSTFGRITSQASVNGQTDYRTLQFALKLYF